MKQPTTRILALDLGEKRIGVAVSDELGIIASALNPVTVTSDEAHFGTLARLIEELGIAEIVVGLPLNMNGTRGPKAVEAEQFAGKLREMTTASVRLWDERLTTVQAERILLEGDLSRKRRKRSRDSLAAQLILQNYLDSQSRPKKADAQRQI